MDKLENVTVVKAVNSYFDGKVTSRTVILANGDKCTLGVMLPGEYEFGTEKRELMEIMSGELSVLLPEETDWKTIRGGESFEVPASSKFQLKVTDITDYCCSYLD